jgi:hypothetical protein
LLRLDGSLDREILWLLTHQNCGARNSKDNAKNNGPSDPQQAFRLGDFGAGRDGALNLRFWSRNEGGAIEFGRNLRCFG